MPKISQIDEVPCQAEVRILQKITLKCCRAVFGLKKEDKDKVKVSYIFIIFPGEEIICLNFRSFIQVFGFKNREERPHHRH